ncbi:MAG: hypothetical protein JW940_35290, partial [Polyangiaceae bacterium]|nr:hypothetical protein [Polyangiaceae bacterium]
MDCHDSPWLRQRITELTGRRVDGPLRVHTDTTEHAGILGGDVLAVGGRCYFVLGDMTEGRFGLDDQPKPWVKRAVDVESGDDKIVKMVFLEDFSATVAASRIHCVRSASKESRVLDAVRGDPHFMQGITVLDDHGNPVRLIDFIRGPSLYHAIQELRMDHARYFSQVLPSVFCEMIAAIESLARLLRRGLAHGDVRNDHLIVERETGRFRWIDFDLDVDSTDFDLWSLGNVISFVVAKGMATFRELLHDESSAAATLERLDETDASMFYPYRVMNLGKVFPYLPRRLCDVLHHFSAGTNISTFY